MGDPGGRVELLEMVGPIKVHEVFLSALLLSQRPPSSRCWPVVPQPPRAIPGAPGRWGPSPAMALLGSLRGEGPFLLSMPPPQPPDTRPKLPPSGDPPRGERPTFCGTNSGPILRARPGRPLRGGPESPGTAAAGMVRSARASTGWSWQTCPRWPQFGGLAHVDFLKQLLLFAEHITMGVGL